MSKILTRFLLALLLVIFIAPPIWAETTIIDAATAHKMQQDGAVLLIDIRRPAEWQQTGIAQGAKTITMHDPEGQTGFLAAMTAGVGGDKTTPIALICSSGVRSTWASAFLTQNGFTQVMNIKEGMLGRGPLPGWIKQKLPLDPAPTQN
ncbi:MAG: rhodanese-like domain-containing protein [Alphaproteobacteria bacterium]|nr:rhodanese-like domain-containing protein [Alphaproteobacteria bacterium]